MKENAANNIVPGQSIRPNAVLFQEFNAVLIWSFTYIKISLKVGYINNNIMLPSKNPLVSPLCFYLLI